MLDRLIATTPLGRSVALLRVLQHVLFVALVLVGVARSLSGGSTSPLEVVAAAVLLGWYTAGYIGVGWVPTGLWLAVLSVLCVAAVWVSPDFAWVSFAVFVTYANTLRPLPATGAIAALAVTVAAVLVGRWPTEGHWAAQIVGPLIGAVVAGALVGISRMAAAEAAERQVLIDELLDTREELARAQLAAGARSERERLHREIHDTLAQGFTSVVLAARRARASADEATMRHEVDHLEQLGLEGVEDARRLLRELPPTELDDRPLTAALQLLASDPETEPAGAARPSVQVRVDGTPRALDTAVEVALLRVAREAVSNACRHSGAARVVVTLTFQPDTVSLDVADDGVGFDPSKPSRGYGMATMRSRTEQLGGTFTVEATPGRGAALNAVVPLSPNGERALR